MNKAIGLLGSAWHVDEPVTEGEAFERCGLLPEDPGMVCGAIMTESGILILSRAEKTPDELRLFGIRESGGAEVLTAHRGSGAIFALGVSLVW